MFPDTGQSCEIRTVALQKTIASWWHCLPPGTLSTKCFLYHTYFCFACKAFPVWLLLIIQLSSRAGKKTQSINHDIWYDSICLESLEVSLCTHWSQDCPALQVAEADDCRYKCQVFLRCQALSFHWCKELAPLPWLSYIANTRQTKTQASRQSGSQKSLTHFI